MNLEGFNEQQAQAVLSRSKRILVFAGAGSGKTKILTTRISHLVEQGLEPYSILAVTFTNKASAEMKERIIKIVGEGKGIEQMWCGTFHSICSRILRVNGGLVGVKNNYQVIDSDDQLSVIKGIINDEKLFESYTDKEKVSLINEASKNTIKYIGDMKDSGKRPKNADYNQEIYSKYGFNIKKIYEIYEDTIHKQNLLDFGDLILYVVELFDKNPEILESYNSRFRHILVDEFQDTNHIQYAFIKHLSKNNYLFAVGDDDQAIYEWRGANVANILNFADDHENVEVIKLEQNYRSTNNILKCANAVISNNKKRAGKNLWSDSSEGQKVKVNIFEYGAKEAEYIAKEIDSVLAKGVEPKDIAILYRANFLSRELENALNRNRIPYVIIGGVGFWARREIKDIMSYICLVQNSENNVAFERAITVPNRGIGKKSIEKIKDYARLHNFSLIKSAYEMVQKREFKGKMHESLNTFVSGIVDLKKEEQTPFNLISKIIEKNNLFAYYKETDRDGNGDEREFNLKELIFIAEKFNNPTPEVNELEAFVNYAALQSSYDKENKDAAVQLMTVHTAKGLEFEYVYLCGMNNGIFPSQKTLENPRGMEEERRLAYVAITRAKKELVVTAPLSVFGRAAGVSQFLLELPLELLKLEGESKYYLKGEVAPKTTYKSGFSNDYFKNNQVDHKKVSNNYKIGDKYLHSNYGEGIVKKIIPVHTSYILEVDFDFVGIKKIIL